MRAGCGMLIVFLGACASMGEVRGPLSVSDGVEAFAKAEALIESGDLEGAMDACERTQRAFSPSSNAAHKAQTAFCFAELERLRWEAIPMTASSSRKLRHQLNAKLQGIKTLNLAYQQVRDVSLLPWTLAADTRMAGVWADVAEALVHTPVPGGLEGIEAGEEYRAMLLEFALPLQNKAHRQYGEVVTRADAAHVSSKYVKMARARWVSQAR